jgi:hypothetical protein
VGREGLGPQRVCVVDDQGEELVGPAADVSLSHPELELLVEHLHHRHRIGRTAVDADERDRSTPATASIEPCSAASLSIPAVIISLRAAASGSSATALINFSATGLPCHRREP